MNWKYLIFAIFVQLLRTNEAKRDPPEVIKDGSGEGLERDLVVTIIKKAMGQKFEGDCPKEEKAEKGDLLKVTYIGRNDGPRGPIFSESKPGGTFAFTLGQGGVITGYSLGTPGMCLGETRTLLVPPHLGQSSILCNSANINARIKVSLKKLYSHLFKGANGLKQRCMTKYALAVFFQN